MTVVSESAIHDHLDFLVMQPDQERAIVRDLVSAVFAFNAYSPGEPLQISFPLFTDSKVSERGVLGPCVRVTGPAEKLYVNPDCGFGWSPRGMASGKVAALAAGARLVRKELGGG